MRATAVRAVGRSPARTPGHPGSSAPPPDTSDPRRRPRSRRRRIPMRTAVTGVTLWRPGAVALARLPVMLSLSHREEGGHRNAVG